MSTESTDKKSANETIGIQIVRGQDGQVDIQSTLDLARASLYTFQDEETDGLERVSEALEEILNNPRYSAHQFFSGSTLAKMVLGILGEMPTDKAEAKIAGQVKAYLLGKGDSIFYISAGRNAGFHVRERYSTADFAKLTKTSK